VEGHCTSERPPFLRRQTRAPTCQPWLSQREVACACSVLARLCARSLWGRGPARALPTRARAAPSWRRSLHALLKSTARARGGRSFGARPVLPRANPAPHCARSLARVARLRQGTTWADPPKPNRPCPLTARRHSSPLARRPATIHGRARTGPFPNGLYPWLPKPS
jgi:hypothetical protein